MSQTLILTEPTDIHGAAIAWGLKAIGLDAKRWYRRPPNAPEGYLSIDPSGDNDFHFEGPDGWLDLEKIGAVWYRRTPHFWFPEELAKSDERIAKAELNEFLSGATYFAGANAFWANPPAGRIRGSNKIIQLMEAKKAGLTIPKTLCTNDRDAANHFLEIAETDVAYKPFSPASWSSNDKHILSYTHKFDTKKIPEESELKYGPGIFQQFVEKAYELRVSIFGKTCVAAKISGQNQTDWRIDQDNNSLEPYQLPEEVETKLLKLMDALDLVMGMADFIVTPQGDYVFLEVNEQGQFLFNDNMNSELNTLEPCVRFLASRDRNFKMTESASSELNIENFIQSDIHKELVEVLEKASSDPSLIKVTPKELEGEELKAAS